MARRSRATRLSKHWAHHTGNATLLTGSVSVKTDLLTPYRAALGEARNAMTVMRIVGSVGFKPQQESQDGLIGIGILVAPISGGDPAALPLGVGADDYTDWMYWASYAYRQEVGAEPEQYITNVDVRAMRKFDPSRETLWMVRESSGGTGVHVFGNWRILCAD